MHSCEYCGKTMGEAASCTTIYFTNSKETILYTREKHDEDDPCGECGVTKGGFHHPGCDLERCPLCGGQAITCGCDLPLMGPVKG